MHTLKCLVCSHSHKGFDCCRTCSSRLPPLSRCSNLLESLVALRRGSSPSHVNIKGFVFPRDLGNLFHQRPSFLHFSCFSGGGGFKRCPHAIPLLLITVSSACQKTVLVLVKIKHATFTPRAWDSLKVLQVDTTPTLFLCLCCG